MFDVETTGTDPATARIVQVAFVLCGPAGELLPGSYVVLVDPGVEVPADAAAVHGITTERARAEGQPAAQVLAAIVRRVNRVAERDLPLVIFNVPFDWRTLQYEADRHHLELPRDLHFVDPLVLDRALDKYRKGSRKLADVCRHYGITLTGAHDARADALATGQLARQLVKRFPALQLPLEQLHERQIAYHRNWREDFNAYQRTRGTEIRALETWPGTLERSTAPTLL